MSLDNTKQPITTTLKAMRKQRSRGSELALAESYQKLVKFLGEGYGDETPIRFSQIVESNGVYRAYLRLGALRGEHGNEVRLLIADVAERVLHIYEAAHPNCKKPRQAIEAARAYSRGEINKEELAVARGAARAASLAATGAAWAAAWVAVRAASLPARNVAQVVMWTAARAASLAATRAGRPAMKDAEDKALAELLIKRFG